MKISPKCQTWVKCADFRILFLDFCKILSVLRLKVSITLFQLLILSLYRSYFIFEFC